MTYYPDYKGDSHNRWSLLGKIQVTSDPNRTWEIAAFWPDTKIFLDRGVLTLKMVFCRRYWNDRYIRNSGNIVGHNLTLTLFLVANTRNCHNTYWWEQVWNVAAATTNKLETDLFMPIIRGEKMSGKTAIQMAITELTRRLLTTSVRFHLQLEMGLSPAMKDAVTFRRLLQASMHGQKLDRRNLLLAGSNCWRSWKATTQKYLKKTRVYRENYRKNHLFGQHFA